MGRRVGTSSTRRGRGRGRPDFRRSGSCDDAPPRLGRFLPPPRGVSRLGSVGMGRRGPKARPDHIKLVEGDPSHEGKARLATRSVRLPPAEVLDEPRWAEVFPHPRSGEFVDAEHRRRLRADADRARRVAAREWKRVVPRLTAHGLLAVVDVQTVREFCVCVARIDLLERDVSRRGVWVQGDRGAVRNPSVPALGQYRTLETKLFGELGLSPAARSAMRLTTPGSPQPDAGHGGGLDGDGNPSGTDPVYDV